MKHVCVFCKQEGKITREHVLPNWLSKLSSKKITVTNEFIGDNPIHWDSLIFQHKAKIVCKECNSGWMSELEVAVKPILLNLLLLNKVTITRKEQAILSFWAQKTVLMLNQGTPHSLKITSDTFEDIYLNKSFTKKIMVNIGWRIKSKGNKQEPIASYEIKQIMSVDVNKDIATNMQNEMEHGGFIWKAVFALGPIVFELIGHNMKVRLEIGSNSKIFHTIQPYSSDFIWPTEWPIEAEGDLDAIKQR